jgi:hypothetical protein
LCKKTGVSQAGMTFTTHCWTTHCECPWNIRFLYIFSLHLLHGFLEVQKFLRHESVLVDTNVDILVVAAAEMLKVCRREEGSQGLNPFCRGYLSRPRTYVILWSSNKHVYLHMPQHETSDCFFSHSFDQERNFFGVYFVSCMCIIGFFCFGFQFCDVATLATIHKRKKPQEERAKFGCTSEKTVDIFQNPAMLWWPPRTHYLLNMVTSMFSLLMMWWTKRHLKGILQQSKKKECCTNAKFCTRKLGWCIIVTVLSWSWFCGCRMGILHVVFQQVYCRRIQVDIKWQGRTSSAIEEICELVCWKCW